jgi:hypothetical protein
MTGLLPALAVFITRSQFGLKLALKCQLYAGKRVRQ